MAGLGAQEVIFLLVSCFGPLVGIGVAFFVGQAVGRRGTARRTAQLEDDIERLRDDLDRVRKGR